MKNDLKTIKELREDKTRVEREDGFIITSRDGVFEYWVSITDDLYELIKTRELFTT